MVDIIEDDAMAKQINDVNTDIHSQEINTTDMPNEFMESLYFSDTAKQMSALKALVFDVPETNHAKIEFLKEEIAAGRYHVNSQRIAEEIGEHQYIKSAEELEIA